ncbi:GyrI-like domain-containing protein [Chryseosolibacter indicus]|uniref:GyrI-like domain-containing protein n=1 Tax=Chryseosolibacter indicus TaxID=2782351 RepID=A0ABS5VQM2_9BACT|nr:GyrI-like domain-containing protein [Chryseosolibacter indicus]MBT1703740.1 GyrI-like domain-containing protein [Chryseosolibacter indicus]
MLAPRIEVIPEKKLIGMQMAMSLTDNKTGFLWKNFMMRRREITNSVGDSLYSVQWYDKLYFSQFNPSTPFVKWASMEVADFTYIPEGMQTSIMPGGEYAVFLHKGGADMGSHTFQYIFQNWLPNSQYTLDDRPHFEVLGEKYKNNDPASEEEIWIPITRKQM